MTLQENVNDRDMTYGRPYFVLSELARVIQKGDRA
jgi:hypothetical protein